MTNDYSFRSRSVLYFRVRFQRKRGRERERERDSCNGSCNAPIRILLTSPLLNFRMLDHKYRDKLFRRIIKGELVRYRTWLQFAAIREICT